MAITAAEAEFLGRVRPIEEATLSGWPSLALVVDGAWFIRSSLGQTGRANSVTILDPRDDTDCVRRMAAAEDVYHRREQSPLYRITPLTPPAVAAACDQRGFETFNQTAVLVCDDLKFAAEAGDNNTPDSVVNDAWLDAVARYSGFSDARRDALAVKLRQLAVPAGFFSLLADNQIAATVLAVVQGDQIGILDLAVAPRLRRQGFARTAMVQAVGWGVRLGGRQVWLQVVVGNKAAEGLYADLGFSQLYTYHYRRPSQHAGEVE